MFEKYLLFSYWVLNVRVVETIVSAATDAAGRKALDHQPTGEAQQMQQEQSTDQCLTRSRGVRAWAQHQPG